MGTKIHIFLIALTIAGTYAKVSAGRGLPARFPVHKDDIIEFDMGRVFDLSAAEIGSLKFEVTQNSGSETPKPIHNQVYSRITPYFSNSTFSASQVNTIKFIDNTTYVIISDDRTIHYQKVSEDGFKVIQEKSWTTNVLPISKHICQDVVASHNTKHLYVACAKKLSTSADPGSVIIFTLDRESGKSVGTQTVDLTDKDFWIANRLMIGTYTLPQGKKDAELIVVYDQGVSIQSETRKHKDGRFMVFQEVAGEVTFDDFIDLVPPTGDNFSAVYDIMNYQDQLVVTGRSTNSPSNIKLFGCTLDLTTQKAACSTVTFDTAVVNGFVAIMNTGQMSKYDYDQNKVTIYDLGGNFGEKTWATEIYSHTVASHDIKESDWIRRYEGNEHAAIFQWTSNNGIDNGITIVSWTLGTSDYYSGITGVVLRQIKVAVDASGIAFYRLTNPFFLAMGSQLSADHGNKLTITATDKTTTNIVKSTGNIWNLGTNRVNVKFNDDASKVAYTDVFADTTFKIPFFYEDWLEGNGVEWKVDYEQSHLKTPAFGLTEIVTEFEPVVNFNPARPTNGFKKLAFTQGGAVAQDIGGQLYFYSCTYPDRKNINCYQKFKATPTDGSTLHSEIHLIGDIMWAYTTNGKTKIGTTVWVASWSEGVLGHNFDFISESVLFTSNKENTNIVIAENTRGKPDSGTVHVYKAEHDIHTAWTLVRKITAGNLGWDYFCPWNIQPDTDPLSTKIHILSACPHLQGIGENRIASFIAEDGHVKHSGLALTGIKGIPQFCPLGDHYIIADATTTDLVWAVDNFQSWAKYHKYVSHFGYTRISKLECFPYAKQYALIGDNGKNVGNSAPDQIYTLLWGDNKFNNLKFVNYLNRGLDTQKWNGLESYQLEDFVIHVGYPDSSFINIAATLNRPPEMKTTVNYIAEDMKDTIVPYTITGYIGIMQNQLKRQVTLRKPIEDIKYDVISRWDGSEQGFLDLEKFTEVWGPITGGSMAGNIKNVTFQDRKRNHGGIIAGDNPMHFDQWRGSYHKGVGLQITGQVGQFALVEESKIVSYSAAYGVMNYDCSFVEVEGTLTQAIILYQASETSGRYISAFGFDKNNKKTKYSNHVKINGDKIRIGSIGDNKNYLGFVLDKESKILRFVKIEYEGPETPPTLTYWQTVVIFDVWDIDIIPHDNELHLYFIKSGDSQIHDLPITYENNGWKLNFAKMVLMQPNPDKKYWLSSIATNTDGKKNFIAATTYGTVIFAIDQDVIDTQNYTVVQTLEKYKDFTSESLFIDDQFVVMRANKMSPPKDSAILVWKTRTRDPTLHTAIDLSGHLKSKNQDVGRIVHYPITLFTNSAGKHIVAVGGSDNRYPLHYWEIHNFGIHLPEGSKNLDLSSLDLVFDGAKTSKVTLEQMLSGSTPGPHPDPVPPGKTFQWWPFLIVLAVLILAAIVWFVYARSKQEPIEEDEYISMQQKTKISDANYVEEGLEDNAGLEGLDDDEGLN